MAKRAWCRICDLVAFILVALMRAVMPFAHERPDDASPRVADVVVPEDPHTHNEAATDKIVAREVREA